jgi:hypothetical protein
MSAWMFVWVMGGKRILNVLGYPKFIAFEVLEGECKIQGCGTIPDDIVLELKVSSGNEGVDSVEHFEVIAQRAIDLSCRWTSVLP